MYPQTHFVTGLVLGQIGVKLGYFNQTQSIILASLALLIDIDHYLYYTHKYHTLSLPRAWQAAITGKEQGERTALHHWKGAIIFTLCLALMSWHSLTWGLLLGLAYYSHLFLDYLPLSGKKIKFSLSHLNFELGWGELILDLILIVLWIGLIKI